MKSSKKLVRKPGWAVELQAGEVAPRGRPIIIRTEAAISPEAWRGIAVAVQAPTHIHFLRNRDGHLAKLPVAMLATESGGNMWTVAEIDKIRQDEHRYPANGLVL